MMRAGAGQNIGAENNNESLLGQFGGMKQDVSSSTASNNTFL